MAPGIFRGVGGVHAVHVGEDLAQVGVHAGGDGHRAGVRTAPAQGGHVAEAVDPLEARDHHDPPLVQLLADAGGVYLLDSGVAVVGGGVEPRLPPQQRDHREAHALDGHGQQRRGDLLPRGEEHVHLPLGRPGVHFLRLGDQVVGGVALGGHDHHHVVALLVGVGDDLRHVPQTLRVPDGRAAEFLHDQRHCSISFSAGSPA